MTTSSTEGPISEQNRRFAEQRAAQEEYNRNFIAQQEKIKRAEEHIKLFEREKAKNTSLRNSQIEVDREKLFNSLGNADFVKTFRFIDTFPPEIRGFLRYGEGLQLALQYSWEQNPQIQNETRERIMDWYDKNLREASVPSVKKPFFMIKSEDLSKLSANEVKFVVDQHILKGKLLYRSINDLLLAVGETFYNKKNNFTPEQFEEAKLFSSRLSFIKLIADETTTDMYKIQKVITDNKLSMYVIDSLREYNSDISVIIALYDHFIDTVNKERNIYEKSRTTA